MLFWVRQVIQASEGVEPCALRSAGLEPTEVTYGSLATQLRGWREASELLREASRHAVRATLVFRNAVVKVLGWGKALEGLQEARREASRLTTISYNTLMSLEEWREASSLLGSMRRSLLQLSGHLRATKTCLKAA